MLGTQMESEILLNEDKWIYLDTDVIRYVLDAFDGWVPSKPLGPGERERVAAFRVFLYARRPARAMFLTTSDEIERELRGRDSWNRIEALLFPVNFGNPQISADILDAEAARFLASGVGRSDARHAAHASLRPWVRYLVTNDRRFRKKAAVAGLPAHLTILDPVDAEAMLRIQPGENFPITLDPWPSIPAQWVP